MKKTFNIVFWSFLLCVSFSYLVWLAGTGSAIPTPSNIRHVWLQDFPQGYRLQVSNKGQYRWIDNTRYITIHDYYTKSAAIVAAWEWKQFNETKPIVWEDVK